MEVFFLDKGEIVIDHSMTNTINNKKEVKMFLNRYIIVFLALLGVFFLNATAEAQKIMSVQVREAQLRATPSFLGKILAKTSYATR